MDDWAKIRQPFSTGRLAKREITGGVSRNGGSGVGNWPAADATDLSRLVRYCEAAGVLIGEAGQALAVSILGLPQPSANAPQRVPIPARDCVVTHLTVLPAEPAKRLSIERPSTLIPLADTMM